MGRINVKKKSQKQEKDVANKMNGKTVVASGALWGAKGDVRTDKYLVEAKTTGNKYYTLNVNTWEKIRLEAMNDDLRIPLMVIDLRNGEKRFVIFDVDDFYNEDVIIRDKKVGQKSIRITWNFVGRDENGLYVSASTFTMQGKNKLYYLRCKEFDLFRREHLEVFE